MMEENKGQGLRARGQIHLQPGSPKPGACPEKEPVWIKTLILDGRFLPLARAPLVIALGSCLASARLVPALQTA